MPAVGGVRTVAIRATGSAHCIRTAFDDAVGRSIGKPTKARHEPAPMGLGSTAKKVQKLGDLAEKLYAQLKDVRERVISLERQVEESNERVSALETDSEKQLVLLKAIAEEQGIDADQVLADAAIDEAETDAEDADAEPATDDGTSSDEESSASSESPSADA